MDNLTYDDIFGKLVKSAYAGHLADEMNKLATPGENNRDLFIHLATGQGDRDKVIYKAQDCEIGKGCSGANDCQVACLFHAIVKDERGNVVIKDDYCTNCGRCVDACKYQRLIDKKEFIPLVDVLKNRRTPVYAMLAPAFAGQFGPNVTPGKLRAALKRLGFYGMVEVALFADMLTLKEALEFDIHVRREGDFILTSCCCPLWVAMVKKVYSKLIPHISPSVSPMVACGRGIKKIHPEARTVFIGPCIAKKAEAKEPDVRDAVDAVITFKELRQIFDVLGIKPEEMEEEMREHSSKAGRIYARTGGVSEAVATTLQRIRPERTPVLKALQADGVQECRILLKKALEGQAEANFYEGMGCVGGCVGGPHVNIDPGFGVKTVNQYGEEAENPTPADNLYVLELLQKMGFAEIDSLLQGEQANMFQRKF